MRLSAVVGIIVLCISAYQIYLSFPDHILTTQQVCNFFIGIGLLLISFSLSHLKSKLSGNESDMFRNYFALLFAIGGVATILISFLVKYLQV